MNTNFNLVTYCINGLYNRFNHGNVNWFVLKPVDSVFRHGHYIITFAGLNSPVENVELCKTLVHLIKYGGLEVKAEYGFEFNIRKEFESILGIAVDVKHKHDLEYYYQVHCNQL